MQDEQGKNNQTKKSKLVGVTILSHQGDSCSSAPANYLKGFLMGDNATFIYLFRKIKDTSFYKDSIALHLAIHCLIEAKRFECSTIIGNYPINLKTGQFITGRYKLSQETGINESTIRRKLILLEKLRFLTIKRTSKCSIITVLNYTKYQLKKGKRPTDEPTDEPTDDPLYKERKESKKVKNVFAPPTSSDLATYCKDQNLDIDNTRFIDFYESKGWMVGKNKMKDWKAAARNWARNNKKEEKNSNGIDEWYERKKEQNGIDEARRILPNNKSIGRDI